jgi:hypothetical protein
VLAGTDDGGIDEEFFQVGVTLQGFRDPAPDAVCFPAGEPDICRVPVPWFLWQVPLGATCPGQVQYRFDKPSIVRRSPTSIRGFPWQQIRNPCPLSITQHAPIHVQRPNPRM